MRAKIYLLPQNVNDSRTYLPIHPVIPTALASLVLRCSPWQRHQTQLDTLQWAKASLLKLALTAMYRSRSTLNRRAFTWRIGSADPGAPSGCQLKRGLRALMFRPARRDPHRMRPLSPRKRVDTNCLMTVDLPYSERAHALRDLRTMNITAESLFAGLEGTLQALAIENFDLDVQPLKSRALRGSKGPRFVR